MYSLSLYLVVYLHAINPTTEVTWYLLKAKL